MPHDTAWEQTDAAKALRQGERITADMDGSDDLEARDPDTDAVIDMVNWADVGRGEMGIWGEDPDASPIAVSRPFYVTNIQTGERWYPPQGT